LYSGKAQQPESCLHGGLGACMLLRWLARPPPGRRRAAPAGPRSLRRPNREPNKSAAPQPSTSRCVSRCISATPPRRRQFVANDDASVGGQPLCRVIRRDRNCSQVDPATAAPRFRAALQLPVQYRHQDGPIDGRLPQGNCVAMPGRLRIDRVGCANQRSDRKELAPTCRGRIADALDDGAEATGWPQGHRQRYSTYHTTAAAPLGYASRASATSSCSCPNTGSLWPVSGVPELGY
jgi:hypothetical protein